jgi:hypothetical protein
VVEEVEEVVVRTRAREEGTGSQVQEEIVLPNDARTFRPRTRDPGFSPVFFGRPSMRQGGSRTTRRQSPCDGRMCVSVCLTVTELVSD